MKFEKIEPGMVLYDMHSHKMGNTNRSTLGVWPVRIISIDKEKRTAIISWNGNKPQTYYENSLSKLKKEEPFLVGTIMGGRRRETREEKVLRLSKGMK